jgi:hypothetical protein
MTATVEEEVGAVLAEAFAAPTKGVARAFTMVFGIIQVRHAILNDIGCDGI